MNGLDDLWHWCKAYYVETERKDNFVSYVDDDWISLSGIDDTSTNNTSTKAYTITPKLATANLVLAYARYAE